MQERSLTAETTGERIDVFLARNCPELTRSAVQRLLEGGCVTSGGRTVKKNEKTNTVYESADGNRCLHPCPA